MTRARTASCGVVTPPPLDRWIEAVLMLCVSLVHGARTTLGMIFKRSFRDWHTVDTREALPQATSGKQSQESNTTHGVILGLEPRISVGTPRGLVVSPLETENLDSRHKAEHHSVGVLQHARALLPRKGGGATRTPVVTSALRWGSLDATQSVPSRPQLAAHAHAPRVTLSA
jgi:hypothetical protein